jgi:hypothetical protein
LLTAGPDRAAARLERLAAATVPGDADPTAVLAALLQVPPVAVGKASVRRGRSAPGPAAASARPLRLVPDMDAPTPSGRAGTHGPVADERPATAPAPAAPRERAQAAAMAAQPPVPVPAAGPQSLAARRAAVRAAQATAARVPPVVTARSTAGWGSAASVAVPAAGAVAAPVPDRAAAPRASDAPLPMPPSGLVRLAEAVASLAAADAVSPEAEAEGAGRAAQPSLSYHEPKSPAPQRHSQAADARPLHMPAAAAAGKVTEEAAADVGVLPAATPQADGGPLHIPELPASAVVPTAAAAPGSSGHRMRLDSEDPLIGLAHHHGVDPSWP